MEIHKIVREIIQQHTKEIELIQHSIISGVASLIYSEYIRNMRQKVTPKRIIMVPCIKDVKDLLQPEGSFMQMLSNHLINRIRNNDLFKRFHMVPELQLFNDHDGDILKLLLDFCTIPNMYRCIPDTIEKKFGINDPAQQLFQENWEISIFDQNYDKLLINEGYMKYIVDEIVLNILLDAESIEKSKRHPEYLERFYFDNVSDIMTIMNNNAVCPIHFNKSVIDNKTVIELLKFVTSTIIEETPPIVETTSTSFTVSTSVFNQVTVTKLHA